MNKNEVFSRVAALVGVGRIESERVYDAALSLALAEICRAAPIRKSFTLRHFPSHPLFRLTESVAVLPTAPLTVSAVGVATLLAEGYGEGRMTLLCNGQVSRTVMLQGAFSEFFQVEALCGNTTCELTLLFTAEAPLTLESLILYSRQVEREACGDRLTYSALTYAPDFLSFDGRVYQNKAPAPDGEVTLREDTVVLPATSRGVYEIGYYASHKAAEDLSGEEEFCVKREVEHLIPLLTAYYVLLEDGNELCEAYLTAYREGFERYERGRRREEERVSDVYGW